MRAFAAALVVLFAAPAPVHAAAPLPVDALSVAIDFVYVPGDNDLPANTLVIHQGDGLNFLNLDQFPHNITADRDPFGNVVFASATTMLSEHKTVEVFGVRDLAPGTYGFHCGVHGVMQGTLIVQ